MGLTQIYDLTGPSVPEVDPTQNSCPYCGRGKSLKHAKPWAEDNYLVYCLRCGYYREAIGHGFVKEGRSYPVQCTGCHRFQSWIRVPPFFRGQEKEALTLVHWTCDNVQCLQQQTVFASLIPIDKIRVPPQVLGQ